MHTNDDAIMYIDYYNNLIDNKILPTYYKSYLRHILEHKKMVYIAWLYIADTLCELDFINENDMSNIYNLIINHDNSKLQKDEFFAYARRFNGPRQKNSIVKNNFKISSQLHKERNLHHYETLRLYKGNNWKHYAIELICDYIAMGWEYNSYICEYFEKINDELKSNLPENYYNYIESIIKIIPEKLDLAEKPLTKKTISYIYYLFNNHNDPFDDYSLKKYKIS